METASEADSDRTPVVVTCPCGKRTLPVFYFFVAFAICCSIVNAAMK
jgi:hypothetical protein